jgi:hypothetical protein
MSYMSHILPDPEIEPTVGLKVAGPALGIRLTKAYELAHTGWLVDGVPVIKVGAKYRVPTVALRRALGLPLDPSAA